MSRYEETHGLDWIEPAGQLPEIQNKTGVDISGELRAVTSTYQSWLLSFQPKQSLHDSSVPVPSHVDMSEISRLQFWFCSAGQLY